MEREKLPEVEIWHYLVTSVDLLRDLCDSQDTRNIDLSYKQTLVMKKVWILTGDAPEGISLKLLAEELGLTAGTVSELVDALVRKDYLCRIQNPDDRREILITLTARSKKFVEEGTQKSQEVAREVLQDFTDTEKVQLIQMLDRVRSNLAALKTMKKEHKNVK